MSGSTRRNFIVTSGLLSGGLATGILTPPTLAQDKEPAMSIARWASPSDEEAAIAEAAKSMTKKAIEALGGMQRFVKEGEVVWVKPNIGWDRTPEQAANTNPDVVATIVELCFEAGASQVKVGDFTCHEERRTYHRSGIKAAAEAAGADVYFVEKRKFKEMNVGGQIIQEWPVYADMYEADALINVPIVKHHGLSEATLGMKNLMGCIEKRNQLHQDLTNTLPDLGAFFKPRLVVIDAIRILQEHGPVGGNLEDVKRKNVLAAGVDQVALDAFGAELLGNAPEEIGYVKEAAARGMGTMDYKSLSPKEITV